MTPAGTRTLVFRSENLQGSALRHLDAHCDVLGSRDRIVRRGRGGGDRTDWRCRNNLIYFIFEGASKTLRHSEVERRREAWDNKNIWNIIYFGAFSLRGHNIYLRGPGPFLPLPRPGPGVQAYGGLWSIYIRGYTSGNTPMREWKAKFIHSWLEFDELFFISNIHQMIHYALNRRVPIYHLQYWSISEMHCCVERMM